jgi:hypothetical protein
MHGGDASDDTSLCSSDVRLAAQDIRLVTKMTFFVRNASCCLCVMLFELMTSVSDCSMLCNHVVDATARAVVYAHHAHKIYRFV